MNLINLLLIVFVNITFLFIFYVELKQRSIFILFWLTLIGLFALPHTIEIFIDSNYLPITLLKTSIFVFLFNFLYLFCRLYFIKVFKLKKTNWIPNFEFPNNIINRRALIIQLFFFLGVAFWIYGLIRVNPNLLELKWNDKAEVKTIISIIGNYLIIFGSPIFFICYITKRYKLLIINLILGVGLVFLLRSRVLLIPLMFPFIIFFLYKKNMINLNLRFIIIMFFIILSIFTVQQVRYLGQLSKVKDSTTKDLVSKSIDKMFSERSEFQVKNGLYFFIENNNNFEGFNKGLTYKRLCLFFIPSPILEFIGLKDLKPKDFAINMYSAYKENPQNIRGTFHPTIYGDAFANFHFFGVLISIFWALFFSLIDFKFNLLNFRFILFFVPINSFLILIARGAIYNGFLRFILALLLVIILGNKLKIFIKKYRLI